jgi:hypothetical protein
LGGSDITLESNHTITQSQSDTELIVGLWEYDQCACYDGLVDTLVIDGDTIQTQAGLTITLFIESDCEEFQLAVNESGVLEQVDAENCCIEIIDPLVPFCWDDFVAGLDTYSEVECEEELPLECDSTFLPGQSDPLCNPNGNEYFCASNISLANGFTTCNVTTAVDADDSPYIKDGVIRLYGLAAQSPICNSDYFDVLDGMELIQYEPTATTPGSARLRGTIVNVEDEDITFEVDMYFENAMSGDEFDDLAGAGFLTLPECGANTDDFIVYTLSNTISRLTGTGSMTGEIYLNHMPMSLNKRFQLGIGANNHNCNLGFGGWFGWQGVLNNQTVMGFSGDVIADLDGCVGTNTDCGGEFVEHTYACINTGTGESIYVTQTVQRNDTQAPTCLNCPADQSYEWADITDDNCNWHVNTPTPTWQDNCPDWDPNNCGCVTFTADTVFYCTGSFDIFRQWIAEDGKCGDDVEGNKTFHNQIVEVRDI